MKRIPCGFSGSRDSIPSDIIEKLKIDDPSWIDDNLGVDKFSANQYDFIELIVKYDAIRSFKELMKPGSFYGNLHLGSLIYCRKDTSRRLRQLAFDLLPMNFNFRKENRSFTKNEPKYYNNIDLTMAFNQAIKNNDLPVIRYLIDNHYMGFVIQNWGDISQNDYFADVKNPDPKIYMFLLDRGFFFGQNIVPYFAYEKNMVDFINDLLYNRKFYIDLDIITPDVVNNMVRNNSIEAIQILLNEQIKTGKGNFISSFFVPCARFGSDEILKLLCENVAQLFKPGWGDAAIAEAARLGRYGILQYLIRPDLVTSSAITQAANNAEASGFLDLAEALREVDTTEFQEDVSRGQELAINFYPNW